MGAYSTLHANDMLNHTLRSVPNTPPGTVYIGLFTSSTGLKAGNPAGADEVSGGSYARVAGTFAAASGGSTSNSVKASFPKATADWGTVTHFAVMTALTGGKILFWAALTASRIILTGDTPEFDAGTLVVTLD